MTSLFSRRLSDSICRLRNLPKSRSPFDAVPHLGLPLEVAGDSPQERHAPVESELPATFAERVVNDLFRSQKGRPILSKVGVTANNPVARVSVSTSRSGTVFNDWINVSGKRSEACTNAATEFARMLSASGVADRIKRVPRRTARGKRGLTLSGHANCGVLSMSSKVPDPSCHGLQRYSLRAAGFHRPRSIRTPRITESISDGRDFLTSDHGIRRAALPSFRRREVGPSVTHVSPAPLFIASVTRSANRIRSKGERSEGELPVSPVMLNLAGESIPQRPPGSWMPGNDEALPARRSHLSFPQLSHPQNSAQLKSSLLPQVHDDRSDERPMTDSEKKRAARHNARPRRMLPGIR